ncbi:ABC transporter permease [Metallibacterium sp.]|uniref:ABC transporter permease n=1 Tax=Metallibacterium sp. TaxID=2940281 RepID=UPI0026284580|nr:ABC transporter permease [Metallibacterium sp.]
MTRLLEALRAAWDAIRAHLLRAALTVLGMVIGVAAVIVVVAVLQGFAHTITAQFKSLGSNGLIIVPYETQRAALAGRQARLTPDDLIAIRQQVRGIQDVVPVLSMALFSGEVRYGNRSTASSITATTPAFARGGMQYPVQGRFIVPGDDTSRRPVAVIGAAVIKNLGLPAHPEGHYIQMFGGWFKVVGVLNKLGTLLGVFNQDNQIYIPFNTGVSLSGRNTPPDISIRLQLAQAQDLDQVEAQIKRVLRRQHHLQPAQEDDFKIQSSGQLIKALTKVFDIITLVVAGIVGIALLVGGVGIMNVLLVSVTERTREIGIQKSLGATRGDILLQFILEALLLSVLGALIGLLLGWSLATLVAHLVPALSGAVVPGWVVVLALGFTATVGLVFGIAPAAKAAALDPIDALRYE